MRPFTNVNLCSTFELTINPTTLTQFPSVFCTEVEIHTIDPNVVIFDNNNFAVGFPIPNTGSTGSWYTITGITNANQLSAKGASTKLICRSKYYRYYTVAV